MPATSNNSGNMSRRQSFTGKGLTSIEIIFDADMAVTATTVLGARPVKIWSSSRKP